MNGFKLYWILTYFGFCGFGCVSFSPFDFLVGIPVVLTSSAVAVKNCACAVTAGINKYKSIIKKKKKKHNKIALLQKIN